MLYLASASPRRQELLHQLGIAFEVLPSNILEVREAGETPSEYVVRVALDKARYVARLVKERGLPAYPVLGADTEVVLDGMILGKPRDRAHGLKMLGRLAGRGHEVLSAVALIVEGGEHTALNVNRVTFGPLSKVEIVHYWETGEPVDKAGGYAIQGRAATFVARIEGSYSGVMGLPLFELVSLLKRAGVNE